jgi:heme-degrading monooxygenase HmoA
MPYLLIKNTVQDYSKWKPVFDQHGAARKAAGSKGAQVFLGAQNPNEVMVLLEWDTLENARKFTASPDLRQVMQNAGVVGMPEISFLSGGERQSQ